MIKQTHESLFKKQYHTIPLCLTLLAMNQVHAVEAGVSPVSKTYVDYQDRVLQNQISQLQTEGVAGPTGATGAAGANGTNGTNGATGATGAKARAQPIPWANKHSVVLFFMWTVREHTA